jgi:hypothetical protein
MLFGEVSEFFRIYVCAHDLVGHGRGANLDYIALPKFESLEQGS